MSHAYLVTLAYGDQEAPTLAQVIYLSETEGEDTRTVAEAVLRHAKNTFPETPRFDWSTLRVNGTESLDADATLKLVDACSKGRVGVGHSAVLNRPRFRLECPITPRPRRNACRA